jgi:putative DNA primase/helicase
MLSLQSLAFPLGGEVVAGQVLAAGPGHGPRDRSLSVRLSATSPDGFMVHSFAGDDWRACRDHVRRALGIEPVQRQAPTRAPEPGPKDDQQKARALATAAAYVAEMRPLRGTPGERYLRDARQINTDTIADVLERTDAIGWHPAVYFNEPGHPLHGQRLGCIVAVMSDPVTAKPTGGISRTYVHNSRKVGKAKGLGHAGVVRLSLDEDVLAGLFVAEGLETALAGMSIGLRPMWSTRSTAIMAKFPIVSGIECVSVIADHDVNGAGERAARELEQRWRAAGLEVAILCPDAPGADFNDVLKGARHEP